MVSPIVFSVAPKPQAANGTEVTSVGSEHRSRLETPGKEGCCAPPLRLTLDAPHLAVPARWASVHPNRREYPKRGSLLLQNKMPEGKWIDGKCV